MKKIFLALALMLGTTTLVSAGNHPALTYPSGAFATTGTMVEVTPWHKGTTYQGGIVVPGPWYTTCPGMPSMVLNSKNSRTVTLLNGKHMMVACGGCKDDAEKNPEKYKIYMY